jgi:Protein of unknown function (DUF3800)
MMEESIASKVLPYPKFQAVTHIPISTILVSRVNHEAILVLKAFFDESGHSASSSFVCMGGCIASLEAWSAFEKEWEYVLRKYEITCFHMNHFESNRREFKKWENEPAKHKGCLADLINIMNDHIDLYIGISANVEDHKLSPPPKNDPYFNCLTTCIDHIASYVSDLPGDQRIEVVFADNPEFGARVRRLYPKVRDASGMYGKLATDTYGFPRDILPLQAADIVAYETNKEWQRQANDCRRPMRWPFTQLIEKPFQRPGLL